MRQESMAMRHHLKVLLIASLLMGSSQARPVQWVRKHLTLQCPAQEGREARQAELQWLEAAGLKDTDLQTRINRALSLQAVTGQSPESYKKEYEDSTWLCGIHYKILYQTPRLLSVRYQQDGLGAYPSTSYFFVNVDLAKGRSIAPESAFRPERLNDLAARLDKMMQREIQQTMYTLKSPVERQPVNALFVNKHFTRQDLKRFTLSAKGVTFRYDYAFAHAILALQPPGEFTLTYAQLSRDIDPRGPLASMR